MLLSVGQALQQMSKFPEDDCTHNTCSHRLLPPRQRRSKHVRSDEEEEVLEMYFITQGQVGIGYHMYQ